MGHRVQLFGVSEYISWGKLVGLAEFHADVVRKVIKSPETCCHLTSYQVWELSALSCQQVEIF